MCDIAFLISRWLALPISQAEAGCILLCWADNMELLDEIEFVRRGSPSEWSNYAVELHQALDILWKQEANVLLIKYESFDQEINKKTHISRTWLLLAAFSIENLLKGILISEHPEYISNGRLASNVTNHSLTNLARNINFSEYEPNEINLLEILEEALPTWARYPIPLTVREIQKEKNLTSNIKETFAQLYAKLDRYLYEQFKDGWQGPHGFRFRGSIRSDFENLPDGWEKMTFDELFGWRAAQSRSADIAADA